MSAWLESINTKSAAQALQHKELNHITSVGEAEVVSGLLGKQDRKLERISLQILEQQPRDP